MTWNLALQPERRVGAMMARWGHPVLRLRTWALAMCVPIAVPLLLALACAWVLEPSGTRAAILAVLLTATALGGVGSVFVADALAREICSVGAPSSSPKAVVHHIREMQDLAGRYRAGTQTLRRMNSNQLKTEESERRRLARELHDELGQELALLNMWLQTLRKEEIDPASGARLLRDSESLAGALMERVRSMSLDLRPAQLDDLGVAAALRSLARRVGRQTGISVTLLALPETSQRFSDAIETALFRVAQAAVTNSVRHAGASTLWIGLEVQDGLATVKVQDDGAGFDPDLVAARAAFGSGMGLLVMQERVQALGGTMNIISGPGTGTLVRASIPICAPEYSA